MMKSILIIFSMLCVSIIYSQKDSTVIKIEKVKSIDDYRTLDVHVNSVDHKYCIISIDSTTFESSYVIDLYNQQLNEEVKLLSLRNNKKCDSTLVRNECYPLKLRKISSTARHLNTTYRLNEYDVFIDGKLIFSSDQAVYETDQLNGLCLSF